LTAAAARQREVLAAEVGEIALQVARKMIGSLADDERLVALATTAAREMMPAGAMTLLVHPDRVDAVQDRLARLAADASDEMPMRWEVRGDTGSPLESCRIETELGSADATLETQMRRLAHAWGIDADLRMAA
jgi:flagellar biosynthesis/type III secretory pathway protein FliH